LLALACSKGDAQTLAPTYKQKTATPASSIQEQNINETAPQVAENEPAGTENAQQEPDTPKTEEIAKEESPKIDMEKLKICAQAGTCGAEIEDDLTIPTPFTYEDYEEICIKNSYDPNGGNISNSYNIKFTLPQYYFQDHIFGKYKIFLKPL
jgi:hypothetical protein